MSELQAYHEVTMSSERSVGLLFSAVFLLLALLAPGSLGILNRLWLRLGTLLSKVVTPLMALPAIDKSRQRTGHAGEY